MPSVRIRDSAYLQALHDDSSAATAQPQTLDPSNQDDVPTPMLSTKPFLSRMRTMPALRNQQPGSTSPQLRPQRSRSGSTASRIHDHILRYSLSLDQQSASSSALPLLSDEGDESQGPFTTSTVSRRSMRHTNADSIRATYGSEILHHDDVIEHLDVIGAWLYYYGSARTNFVVDPQVSTVSSLANAANTILM
jgi:hypothetical protein